MKRLRILCAALCLALALTACGGTSGIISSGDRPSPPGGKTYNDSFITELYTMDGSYTDEWDNEYTYSLHVPQVSADSADAEALNREIAETYQADVEALQDALDNGYSITVSDIAWESHWTGSLLSLVVSAQYPDVSNSYNVYHFDFADGKRLTGAEVLSALDVDGDAFLTEVHRAAARTFDNMYAGVDVMDADTAGYLAPLRAMTIAMADGDVPFVPNPDGSFIAYLNIGSIAGAGWYAQPVAVELSETGEESGAAQDSEYNAYRIAIISGGRGLEGYSAGTGQSYPVYGCYGNYTDVMMATAGDGGLLYAFALTDTGHVEVVDIYNGVEFSNLSNRGPLFGLPIIESLKLGSADVPVAVAIDGTEYDLTGYVAAQTDALDQAIAGQWQTEDESFILTCEANGETTLYAKEAAGGSYTAYRGVAAALGMCDGGLFCTWFFQTDSGLMGAWAVNPDFGGLTVSTLDGQDLFGGQSPVSFQQVWE